MARVIAIFFIALALTSGLAAVLFPGDPTGSPELGVQSAWTGWVTLIACVVVSVLLTYIDMVQYRRFRKKRNRHP